MPVVRKSLLFSFLESEPAVPPKGTGRNSGKNMGISAAMLSFVLLALERSAGEGASAATAAISQRARWQQKCLSRGVTDFLNPEKTRSHHNGLLYPKVEICKEILFVNRDEWGARPPKAVNSFNIPGGVSYVFFYHTGGEECSCKQSCAKIIGLWQRVHQDCQGWDDISYTFIIGGDGMVFEGRGWDHVGAHTVGFNDKSLSLAFVGNYSRKVPNEPMLQAAKNLIECGIQLNKISATYTLLGQADVNCRESPGEVFHAFMKNMSHFGGTRSDYECTPSPWD